MKIGVDAGCLGIKDERLKVGVYNVVKNFLIELGKLDKDNIYLLYSFEKIDKNLMAELGQNFKNIIVKPKKGWLKVWLPIRIFLDRPDIFLALNQSLPLISKKIKIIGFVYDLAFELFPGMYSYYSKKSLIKMKKNSRFLASKADKIITISEHTKSDLIEIYGVKPKNIRVIYPGISKSFKLSEEKYKNKRKYFLFVGALKKTKNIPNILKSFYFFLKKAGENYDLLIAGGDKWLDSDINTIIQELNLKNNIKFLGYIKDKDLPKLYRGAIAYISPSYYEGFGLTLLEAMSCGCPVITSNKGSIPELIQDAGILLDPNNCKDLSNAMLDIIKNKHERENLIKKGVKRAGNFSWQKFTKEVYSEINNII